MTRTRHDRQDDHFGFDLDTNILLSGSVAGVAAGQALADALAALDAATSGGSAALINDTRVISTGSLSIAGTSYPSGTDLHALLAAVGSGGGGITDFLIGDDSILAATLGNWVSSSGTLAFDPNPVYGVGAKAGSAKWTIGNSGSAYLEVPVSGTFKAGKEYHAVVALRFEDTTDFGGFPFLLELGVPGTDSRQAYTSPYSDAGVKQVAFFIVRWIPTADRTTVKLRLTRQDTTSGSKVMHLSYARVVSTGGTAGLSTLSDARLEPAGTSGGSALIIPLDARSSGGRLWISYGSPTGVYPSLIIDQNSAGINGGGLTSGWIEAGNLGWIYMSAGGDFPAADLANDAYELDVGPDYLDLMINQKDAGTIQLFSYYYGADIELADKDSGTWRHRSVDGGIAIPSRGQLPQFASAPTTPAEGWSYYDTTLHKSRTWDGSAWQNWW